MTGTIKTKHERRFGFIAREDGEKDVFFHESALVPGGVTFDELKPSTQGTTDGTAVTFEVDNDGPKGPAAKNVALA